MELTDEVKKQIDAMDYEEMLRRWRFAPVGDAIFSGAAGGYYAKRMFALRDKDPQASVSASKQIGWDK